MWRRATSTCVGRVIGPNAASASVPAWTSLARRASESPAPAMARFSLVCAKALQRNGGGQLFSYDQHARFVQATSDWLTSEGCRVKLRHAPLTERIDGWPGRWYDLADLPPKIDLLIIDGKIRAVGTNLESDGAETIDATGRAICQK